MYCSLHVKNYHCYKVEKYHYCLSYCYFISWLEQAGRSAGYWPNRITPYTMRMPKTAIGHCHLPLAIVFLFEFSKMICWFPVIVQPVPIVFLPKLLIDYFFCFFFFAFYLLSIFLKSSVIAFIGASATRLPWSSSSRYVWYCQSLLSIRYWQMSSLLSIATDKCHPYCQSLLTNNIPIVNR